MAKNEVDVSKLSTEELEELLKKRKKKEQADKQKAKATYEKSRDELVSDLMKEAVQLHAKMAGFKKRALKHLDEFREEAKKYGDIKSSSKGGFSLRHSITQEMVSFDRNVVAEYDERAALAEELIKEFLEDKVKKRDLQSFNTIQALLVRNKGGDFTPSRVASLLKIKDNYQDERWQKAMELFQESYRVKEISNSVSFFIKDEMRKDKAISLTFATIPVEFESESDEPENQSD